MTITVVGLGKIGLPLAVQYAMKGKVVFGADINPETVDLVNKGLEPFPEEENLKEHLKEVVNAGRLNASINTTDCVKKSNVVVVVVPLFVNENAEPDFASMDAATDAIASGLQKGTLIAYETTLPVGTTRNRFTKRIEQMSGLKVGEDFFVVFSPERVLTGRVFSDLRKYPKIVGGVTDNCARKGLDFYKSVLDFDIRNDLSKPNGVWLVDSCEASEFVKLAETTYRDVNIGLANQFSKFANKININIHDVIEASNSQPYSHIHQPGIAVGGHCIPIYPQFYLWSDPEASIVAEARKTNACMPENYIFGALKPEGEILTGKSALVIGASYRAGVKESAFSGVFSLVENLETLGMKTYVVDELYDETEIESMKLKFFRREYVGTIKVAVIHTPGRYTEDLLQELPKDAIIIDGRNFISKNLRKKLAPRKIYPS
jgi:nucleotide sugar dehydrogenase